MQDLPKGYILFNKYKILETIHIDLTGIVYSAEYENKVFRIKEVFLKEISKRNSDFSISIKKKEEKNFYKYKQNLINETGILQLVDKSNPNILNHIEFIEANNTLYSIEEHIENSIPLSEYKFNHTNEDIIKFLKDISNGLHALHKIQIIHRNIKPSNILYANEKFIISDFSFVKKFTRTTTIALTIIGDKYYHAPEQFEINKNIGEATDIYAMGATLFTLLSNKKIADIDRRKEVENRELKENILENQIKRLKIRDKLKDIIFKMVQFDYSKRYKDLRELDRDIKSIEELSNKSDENKKNKLFYILGIVMILVVGCIFLKDKCELPPPPPTLTPSTPTPPRVKFGMTSLEPKSWSEADSFCKNLNERLPTINELKTLEGQERSVSYWSNECFEDGLFKGNCEVVKFNKRKNSSSINKLKEDKFLVKCAKK
jgi:serine/threonine protein kinase